VPRKFSALAISVGSLTGFAWAVIERPVIAIGSATSWSMVNEIGIISREVGRLLALRAEEIDRQAVVHVSNSGCLRPAIRPICRDGHEPMLIQKRHDLGFQSVVDKLSPNAESRATAWLRPVSRP
jgi:hypothetical protein